MIRPLGDKSETRSILPDYGRSKSPCWGRRRRRRKLLSIMGSLLCPKEDAKTKKKPHLDSHIDVMVKGEWIFFMMAGKAGWPVRGDSKWGRWKSGLLFSSTATGVALSPHHSRSNGSHAHEVQIPSCIVAHSYITPQTEPHTYHLTSDCGVRI